MGCFSKIAVTVKLSRRCVGEKLGRNVNALAAVQYFEDSPQALCLQLHSKLEERVFLTAGGGGITTRSFSTEYIHSSSLCEEQLSQVTGSDLLLNIY